MRVVSLCPSITETAFALGAGSDLVGVTRYCIRPERGVAGLERIGGTKNPDLARIRALRPDLVLANAEENRHEDVEALAREFSVHLSLPKAVADVPAHVRELGRALSRAEDSEPLALSIEGAIADARSGGQGGGFRFAYFIWKDPWMTVSGDTYISDLFGYAGGVNVFADAPERYPTVTPDEVARTRPDRLFFASEPFPFSERHRTEIERTFGPEARISFVDGDDCCWHGVRTIAGLALMRRLKAGIA